MADTVPRTINYRTYVTRTLAVAGFCAACLAAPVAAAAVVKAVSLALGAPLGGEGLNLASRVAVATGAALWVSRHRPLPVRGAAGSMAPAALALCWAAAQVLSDPVVASAPMGAMEAVSVIVAAPVAEELLFRGVLFDGVAERSSIGVACAVSAVAFAAFHASLVDTGWLLSLGAALCLVRARLGLAAAVLCHTAFNGCALVAGPAFCSIAGSPDPALSLCLALLSGAASIIGLGFARTADR